MSITRIKSYGISDGAITTGKISGDVSLGVKIANVQIANSSYGILDDTAVALEGGYLVINGAGFASGCQVIVGANTATSTTFVNSTTIRAQVGAADAGTKTLYVVNTDGGTAIRVNGLTYSATPTWVTGSTLTESSVDEAISIQLSANDATSYQLQTGSSLPTGLTLAANGLLSGTVTGIEEETTYNFTIEAIDDENQESPRSFSITITFGDLYFYATTLLLDGDGANGANNNTFVDSSNNNFAITRNGNTTQGTFSPFSAPDGRWGNYFDGNGDYLTVPDNAAFAFSSGNFTIECWVYMTGAAQQFFVGQWSSPQRSWAFLVKNSGTTLSFVYSTTGSNEVQTDGSISAQVNTWAHFAVVRNGNSLKTYMNGTEIGSRDVTGVTLYDASQAVEIGRNTENTPSWNLTGYISNVRIVKGTAVYTSNFTPSTSPLTAITNTSLLTCQSNRFKDNSINNFTITPNGNVSVTSFAPFAPTSVYSAATNGASGYFDGTGYTLTASNSALQINGTYTVDCWFYINDLSANRGIWMSGTTDTDRAQLIVFSTGVIEFYERTTTQVPNAQATSSTGVITTNQWYNVSVTSNGSTVKIYVNGSEVASSAITGVEPIENTFRVGIARSGATDRIMNGYISNLRVIKGSVVTPPAGGYTSILTAISETELLLNFTNAGILDYTGKNNLETVGNAQISTSVKKYGTGSLAFDGTGDWLLMPSTQDLSFGTGNFTIEMWIYPTSLDTTTRALVSNRTDAGADTVFACAFNTTNGLYLHTQNTAILNSGDPPTINAWQHVAFVRNNGTLKIYLDGVEVGSASFSQNLSGTQQVYIGKDGAKTTSPASPYIGYIDDLRITNGFARYTSNFTPPISAHRLR